MHAPALRCLEEVAPALIRHAAQLCAPPSAFSLSCTQVMHAPALQCVEEVALALRCKQRSCRPPWLFYFNVHAGRVHAPLTAMPVCLQACAARGGDQRCGRSRITLHAAQLPPPLFIKRLTCAQEICTRRLCGDTCVLASLRRLLRRLEGEQHECVHSLL